MATTASGSTRNQHRDTAVTARGLGVAAGVGALTGVGAAMVMALFAMIAAATYQHNGFFTPLYHIASTFISADSMMTSMQHAMMGTTFYFTLGPALVGAMIHMMIGAMYGALFAVAASILRLHGPVLIASATVWGAVVFALSSWVALPLAAAVFDSGDQITHMASMVGYGTFLIEHLLFGMTLGTMLLLTHRARRR